MLLRFYFFTLLLVSAGEAGFAQKQDNIWLFGYEGNDPNHGFRFRFDDSLVISYEQRPMDFASTSACISDSVGNLLLYSNGCYIENAEGSEVEGGDWLNPGLMYNLFCATGAGYNIPMGMFAVPDPKRETLVHFFHLNDSGDPYGYLKSVLHTLVDMSANNGQGLTLVKNHPIILDTISVEGFHAVKHANGRDWWILAAKDYSNKYYLVLLSPEGLSVQDQIIGEPTWSGAGGEIVFSPDGTKLARFNTRDDLRIFDFDRCTGELSNPVFVPMSNDADNNFFAGLAWSADGRYLYAAEVKYIRQFDTWASDIAATMTLVAERPPSPAPYLAYLELGPDGYIYGRSLGGQRPMHRIRHPERGGLACEVQQSYYEFEHPYGNLPHFPNYRLGPVDGSPCDTLGLDNHPLAGWRYDKTGSLGVDFTSVSWYEPDTWHWDFGDPASGASNQSSERNPAHAFSAPGAYEVCLTVSNSYGSDTKCKWVWLHTSSVPLPTEEGPGMRLYPNPTTGWVTVPNPNTVTRTIHVFDIAGKQVLQTTTSASALDLSSLGNGVYLLRVKDAGTGETATAKLIINK